VADEDLVAEDEASHEVDWVTVLNMRVAIDWATAERSSAGTGSKCNRTVNVVTEFTAKGNFPQSSWLRRSRHAGPDSRRQGDPIRTAQTQGEWRRDGFGIPIIIPYQ
jgi:hypothetical protein